MNTHFFSDTSVMLGRTLRHVTRSLDTIITTTLMPIWQCDTRQRCGATAYHTDSGEGFVEWRLGQDTVAGNRSSRSTS